MQISLIDKALDDYHNQLKCTSFLNSSHDTKKNIKEFSEKEVSNMMARFEANSAIVHKIEIQKLNIKLKELMKSLDILTKENKSLET